MVDVCETAETWISFLVGNKFVRGEVTAIFFAKEKDTADRRPIGSRGDDRDKSCGDDSSSDRPKRTGEEHRGLCVNCANRETCLYPKPEGGVWHCEEYMEDR